MEEKNKTTKKASKNVENLVKNAKKLKNDEKTSKKSQKNVKNSENSKKIKNDKVSNIKILGFHDLPLNTYIYENVESPKAVIVIVHGMQEHCLRYKHFAEFLNKNNFIAIASDLRGHGKTSPSKELLGFGEKDIFQETLQDQIKIVEFAKEKYNLPIYVFGHSYGSMLSQNLVQMTDLIEKCVICGTTNGSSLLFKLGSFVISLMSPFKNKNSKGGIVEAMCIKSYGKKFERGNWLTRDEKIFDAYQKDEYCGGSFPFSFYKSMIKNMTKANKNISKIGNKKLFLIAGDKDPVGESGKQVEKLYKIYLKNNIDVQIKLYKDARHELLNEINRDEVYKDILKFFN